MISAVVPEHQKRVWIVQNRYRELPICYFSGGCCVVVRGAHAYEMKTHKVLNQGQIKLGELE